jgi:hypothetical protein
MGCVILSENHSQPIPVYDEVYACKKQGGNGYNIELKKCLEYLRKHFDKSVVRVLDSGNDSGNTFRAYPTITPLCIKINFRHVMAANANANKAI